MVIERMTEVKTEVEAEVEEQPDTQPTPKTKTRKRKAARKAETALPSELSKEFIREFAQAMAQRQTQETTTATMTKTAISPTELGYDPASTVPLYQGKFYPYIIIHTDPEDDNRLTYSIVFMPAPENKVLQLWPLKFPTRFGPQEARGYVLWTVIKGRTLDRRTRQTVPIKVLYATPALARQDIIPSNIINKLTYEEILRGVETVEKHDALIIAQDAMNFKREADTAWEIVNRAVEVSHFRSTADMLAYAAERQDMGDEAMARSFVERKDWRTWLKENGIWVIFLAIIIIVIALNNAGVIG